MKLCEAIGCSIPSNSKVSAGLLAEQKCFENNQVRCGSAKRKIKRKFRRNNLYKLYEKHQEKISYRKAQLLLKKAKKRQLRAKVSKDHCYTLKSCTLRQTTKKQLKRSHLQYNNKKQSSYPKMQDGECSVVQLPSLNKHHETYFLNDVRKPGDLGLCTVSHGTGG